MRWMYFPLVAFIFILASIRNQCFAGEEPKEIYLSSHQYKETIPEFRNKIELLNQILPDSAIPLAIAMKELAAAYYRKNIPDSALYFAKGSFILSKKLNRWDLIHETSKILQNIYNSRKDWKHSAYYLKEEISAKDSINRKEVINELTRQEIKLEYKNKRSQDSLRNLLAQKEKDNLIQKQERILEEENNLRNTVILICLLLIMIGWWIYRLKILKIQYRENQLRIESLETQQQLLRAQMNPHYIFNSLSTIQGMLLNNQTKESKKYLQKFSSMLRAVLDFSTKKYISLQDEIRTTELYLETEKLRFGKQLNYSIQLAENIMTNSIMVPPLIMQPLVENAIKHGIQHKDNGGNVSIYIQQKIPFLSCIIQDDGIGRKAAEEIQRESLIPKKSLALEISLKRLRTKLSKKEINGDIIIEDLYDDDGRALGTKVEIQIPFKTEKL